MSRADEAELHAAATDPLGGPVVDPPEPHLDAPAAGRREEDRGAARDD
jgi:hypothetical protein